MCVLVIYAFLNILSGLRIHTRACCRILANIFELSHDLKSVIMFLNNIGKLSHSLQILT